MYSFQDHGLATYVAMFEPTYPKAIFEALNITALGPDLNKFLDVKFRELFANLPHLDGVMVQFYGSYG